MTENSGFIGLGATLEISDGASPEVWAAIANVKTISGPDESTEIVDVTHLSSTGGFREKRPHLQDSGEVGAEADFDPDHATHNAAAGILYIKRQRLRKHYRINYSGCADKDGEAVTWAESFYGYVTGASRSTPQDDNVKLNVTVTIDGPTSLEDLS